MNTNIKVIPVLHSEDGFYLCFTPPKIDAELEKKQEQWQEVYTRRFGAPPAEVRYNEVARLYELGPVPVNS